MKFCRVGKVGDEIPAVVVADELYDISHIVDDITPCSIEGLLSKDIDVKSLKKIDGNHRVGAPIKRAGKIICIGLNYADHAKESGLEVPKEPVVFFKASSSLCGPYDDVEIPRNSKQTDWEVELGVVIGKRAKYVSQERALEYVGGFTLINDVSEREFQIERCGQWVKGKSHDTFCPTGPFIATKDEVKDFNNLSMYLEVDGKRYQDGNTNTMVYKVPFLVSYLSQFMTLEPGDIISTGTPPGVGLGQKPPIYLKPNQVMQLSIEGLGVQKQKTIQA